MGRNAQMGYSGKVSMRIGIQLIGEQMVNPGTPEFAGRQTDVVDNQHIYLAAVRAFAVIRGLNSAHPRHPMVTAQSIAPLH